MGQNSEEGRRSEEKTRQSVVATEEFHGKQTREGGLGLPTGHAMVSDYAYIMRFDGGKIGHFTKIWNDLQALRGLGWA